MSVKQKIVAAHLRQPHLSAWRLHINLNCSSSYIRHVLKTCGLPVLRPTAFLFAAGAQ